MKRIITFFVLLCICCSSQIFAQGVSSLGTDFWVGFMPNFNIPAAEVALHIASGTANIVTIEFYSGSTDGKPTSTRTLTLKKDEAVSVVLPLDLSENWEMEKAVYKGIHVTAKNPIVVYATSNGGATADGYLALPTPGLGTEYYAACMYDDKYISFPWPLAGEFMIIAPYDGTVVTIKTTADTRLDLDAFKQGHKMGDQWTVSLRRGQCYLVQSSGIEVGDQDLTGSKITSNKPIALVSGHQRCAVPVAGDDVDSRDHLIEMIPSVDKWGTQYFERSFYGRNLCGDLVRLISAEDGNVISINGNQTISLGAGEVAERPLTIGTEVYTSLTNKKFLAVEYLYSELHNGDIFHIDPAMIVLTPQNQFQKKIILRTIVNPADPQSGNFENLITVVCRADSIDNILLNGEKITTKTVGPKAIFLNTNPQMAARYARLGSGAKTIIATSNEPMGIYLYGYTTVESYGFPAGMALTVESPDTLPPLHAPKETCGDYDVLLREPRLDPNPFDDTKIIQITLITEPDDIRLDRSVSHRPSTNYTISFAADFDQSGAPIAGEPDSSTSFFLRVIDKTKDAFASVWTTDLAGNDTVFEYSYTAPKINPITGQLSFTPTLVGTDSCRSFVVRNLSTTGSITFTEALVDDTAKFGKFTVTPNILGKTLAPGDSVLVTLCYKPTDTLPSSLDMLTLRTTCVDFKYPLNGLGVTPLIYAEDLDFGDVDSGDTKCLPLTISNPGKWPLTINKQDLPSTTEYSVGASVTFPIIVPPGGSVTIEYCFHPTSYGVHTATAFFTTENPSPFLHSIKDTSNLRGRVLKPGAKWHLFTLDYGKVNCTVKPTIIDTLYNDEQKGQVIDKVEIIGTDATSFRIASVSPVLAAPYSTTLATRSSGFAGYAFTIEFDPNVKVTPGPAVAQLVAYQSGETDLSKQPTAFLTGERIAPVLGILPNPATVDLGTTVANGTLAGQFDIQNTGDDILRVTSITSASPDAALFVLTPPPPFTVAPGTTQKIDITFNAPSTAGSFTATYSVLPEACAVQLPITILAQTTSTQFQIQGADYPLTYVCRTRDTTLAYFTNLSSNEVVTLESVTVEARGTRVDVNDFILITPWTAKPVAPGGKEDIAIRFIPQAPGTRQASLVFVYRRADGSLDTAVADLGGVSDAVQRVAGVGNTTTGGSYTLTTNETFDIPIVLNNALISQTSEAYGVEFVLSWQQDLFNITQLDGPPGMVPPTELSKSVDPITKIESRKYRLSNPGIGIGALTSLGNLKGRVMVAKDTLSQVTVSDVTFLDVNMQPTLCYIQTQVIPGIVRSNDVCGDPSLRLFLNGGPVFTIDRVNANANRIATVEFTNRMSGQLNFEVRNALGAIVKTVPASTFESGAHTVHIPVGDLPSGMYVVRMTDGINNAASDRFLLSR
jgi:hypothetical protein